MLYIQLDKKEPGRINKFSSLVLLCFYFSWQNVRKVFAFGMHSVTPC